MFRIKILLVFLCLILQPSGEDQFAGIVKPLMSVELAFPVDGPVREVLVSEGQMVSIQDSLIRLEDSIQAMETERRKLIYEDTTRLDTSRKEEALLKESLASSRDLFQKTRSISQDELRNLQMKYDMAFGNYAASKELKKRELVEYQMAATLLEKHSLKSPISGIVTKVKLKAGEWARSGESVVTIVDASVCDIDLNVHNQLLSRFSKNQEVLVRTMSQGKEITRTAEVIFVSPVADQASGLVLVRARFDNQDFSFTPGVAAEVVIRP